MPSLLFLFFAALSACLLATAQGTNNAFIRCIDSAGAPTTFKTPTTPTSSGGCIVACRTAGYSFAYFTRSSTIAGTTQGAVLCTCDNAGPSAQYFSNSLSATNINCATASDFSSYKISTASAYNQCALVGGGSASILTGTTASVDACLVQCRNWPLTFIRSNFDSLATDDYYCVCEMSGAQPPGATCADDAFTVLQKSAAAAVSGLTRRKLRQAALTATLPTAHCPTGLTACNVRDSPGSYECIDTSTELESCGGCIYGSYGRLGSNRTETKYDCTTYSGVPMGAMTCTSGSCQASICHKGYKLVNGHCLR